MIALLFASVTFALASSPSPSPSPDGDVIQLHKPNSTTEAPSVTVAKPIAVTPADVAWKPGPPSLPAGTQIAVLEGDPTKPGIVTMRLKIAKGFRLAMHTHPADERVTVMSGTMRVTYVDTASGSAAGQTSTRIFPAGSFYVTPKGMPHAVAVDEETVIQITVQGPWGVAYVDPKDDPRK